MPELQEVVPIQDTLCSGIGKVEFLEGGLIRFWLYVCQQHPEDGEEAEKVVVAKIVGSTSGLPDALQQLMAAINPRTLSMMPIVTSLMMN